jgi:hypothetical protein
VPLKRRVNPLFNSGHDGLTELALQQDSLSAESTPVLSRASAVRAVGSAGGLGCFLDDSAVQSGSEGSGDNRVLGCLRVGLCTAACKLARGRSDQHEQRHLSVVLEALCFGLVLLIAIGWVTALRHCGVRNHSSSEVVTFDRCARALFFGCRSQQESSGSEKPLRLRPRSGDGA